MVSYLALLQVLESNSFSLAAKTLGYTQSAVSQMIKSLEAELGVTLLVRSRTGVALTREGEAMLPYIRDVARAHQALSDQAASLRGLEQGVVRIGSFNTTVSLRDLSPASSAPPAEKSESRSRTRYIGSSKSASVRPEINLIGQDTATAVSNLDKYLDDAYLARLESVRVVHGKGTGALRQAVADHLKRVPYVKGFHAGAYGEGDMGVTIVEFK